MNEKLPLVSVVVITKNEEKNIENCLKSVLNQTYPNDRIEIIVVDNNSTDRTKEIAEQYTAKVFNRGPERSAQRNFGAQQAQGRYYLYLDADMALGDNVIRECVKKFENRQLVGLYIPEIVTGHGLWAKARGFERSFYNATAVDCVRCVFLKDFLAVNGFDETMSGPEDWDFDKKIRAGGRVDIIKSAIYHNETNFNLKKYLTKKAYYAKSFRRYIAKWDKNDRDTKKQFGFYYRFIGVFIEQGKWKKLLRHPVLTVEMYFLRILVGFVFLIKTKLAN